MSNGVGWTPRGKGPSLGDVAAAGVWTAALMVFFWDAVTLKGAFFYFDVTEINYPYRDFLAREIRLGRFSRWFPGLYCGMPLFSESQAGYLHPLKYLFYPWMATWKAFNLENVASVWLTGLATYGWLRRHVGCLGALTGAAIFGLSGFVWAHFIHTSMNNALTSVPLVIWATEWAWSKGRTAGVALGGMALAAQVFAGHLQDTLFTAALVGLYTAYRIVTESGWGDRLRTAGVGLGVIALGVTLAAVQWIPSKELLDRSPRAGGLTWSDLTYGSWHPELLPALVAREAYGTRARDTDWLDGFYPYHEMNAYLGMTAVALALIGAGACRDRWVAFWILVAGIASVLMLGKFTCLFDYANRIPIAGSSRIPVRFHLWQSLAVSALAAVGVDRLARGLAVKLKWALIVPGLMIVACLPILLYAYSPALEGTARATLEYHRNRNAWLFEEATFAAGRSLCLLAIGLSAAIGAARVRSEALRPLIAAILPVVVIVDLMGSHWRDAPTIDPKYWTTPPLSAQKILADPLAQRVYGIADRSAGEPGYASTAIDFLSVRDPLDWSLAPVWGLSSARGETPLISSRILHFNDHAPTQGGRFDLQGVTHFVAGRGLPALKMGTGEPAGSAFIYKHETALPRIRLLGNPTYSDGLGQAIEAISALTPETHERLIVEDPDRPVPQGREAWGSARIVKEEPERLELEVVVESDAPAYLTIADTYDPGWSATIDGRPAAIRPAWVMFRALAVAPGKHVVLLKYRPAGFVAGAIMSAFGLAVTIALLFWIRRLRPFRDDHDPLEWPRYWPGLGLVAVGLLIAVSAVEIGPDGSLRAQSRWSGSFHRFTWGAGVEAMKQGVGGPARSR